MSDNELRWLHDSAKKMESVVEIGSWRGRSTHALLSGCPGTVWAIDHFQGSPTERNNTHADAKTKDIYQEFMANVGMFPNLKVLKMDSIEASKQFEPKSIEMIFIDGDHDFGPFCNDLRAWLPVCKKLICGHDLTQGEIKKALGTCGIKFQPQIDSLWAWRLE
jgi:hypothetical protein